METKPKKPRHEPFGRPTKYEPRFCEMLIDHMASGFSYESFAGVLSIARQTLYEWEKSQPDFLDAKKIGSERNLLYWEHHGREGLYDRSEYNEQGKLIATRKLNSAVWIFNMKNRHKWKDKQDEEVSKTTILVQQTKEALIETMRDKPVDELLAILEKNTEIKE